MYQVHVSSGLNKHVPVKFYFKHDFSHYGQWQTSSWKHWWKERFLWFFVRIYLYLFFLTTSPSLIQAEITRKAKLQKISSPAEGQMAFWEEQVLLIILSVALSIFFIFICFWFHTIFLDFKMHADFHIGISLLIISLPVLWPSGSLYILLFLS